jgi:hypothetical protein
MSSERDMSGTPEFVMEGYSPGNRISPRVVGAGRMALRER